MKKLTCFATLAAITAMLITGCDGKKGGESPTVEPTTIEGTLLNTPLDALFTMKLIIEDSSEGGRQTPAPGAVPAPAKDVVLATAKSTITADGIFSIALPLDFPTDKLMTVADLLGDSDVPVGDLIELSNPAVKFGMAEIALFRGSEKVGEVNYGMAATLARRWESETLVWVDSDCTASGSTSVKEMTIKCDLDMKKGWNWVFTKVTSDLTNGAEIVLTSSAPENPAFYFPGTNDVPEPEPTRANAGELKVEGKILNIPTEEGAYTVMFVDDEMEARGTPAPIAADGAFSVTLPAGPLDIYPLAYELPPFGLTITGGEVKVGKVGLLILKDGEPCGVISHGVPSNFNGETGFFARDWTWADIDSKITGTIAQTPGMDGLSVSYNLDLKGGRWSSIYTGSASIASGGAGVIFTTTPPAGEIKYMIGSFGPGSGSGSGDAPRGKVPALRDIFRR